MGTHVPRLLVTGFGPFPGAPVNPTLTLVRRWQAERPRVEGMGDFRAEILPVDYGTVGDALSSIGRDFEPDIAVHFGLATECRGFRLERLARNVFEADRPDNSGTSRAVGPICAGPATIPTRLPLEAMAQRLEALGLPVEWSDDAGGYLCNMVMTLSLAHACEGFAPGMSGFVHVTLVGEGAGMPMSADDLHAGALAILETCCSDWRRRHAL